MMALHSLLAFFITATSGLPLSGVAESLAPCPAICPTTTTGAIRHLSATIQTSTNQLQAIMGSSQSKVDENAVRDQVVERLRAFHLRTAQELESMNGDTEKDNNMVNKRAAWARHIPRTEDVSISTTEDWAKELLEDTKLC